MWREKHIRSFSRTVSQEGGGVVQTNEGEYSQVQTKYKQLSLLWTPNSRRVGDHIPQPLSSAVSHEGGVHSTNK